MYDRGIRPRNYTAMMDRDFEIENVFLIVCCSLI